MLFYGAGMGGTEPAVGRPVAVVTGAAKGIGYGIARRFEREDYRVSVWDIDLAPLEESRLLAQQIQVDVTDPDSVELAVERTLSAFERIDILVNNAGVSGPTLPAWEYPIDAWDRVLAVDLTGVFLCCRAVIPHMRERGAGRIVNVASIVGKEGNALAPAYSAAKAGVIGLTKSLAKDLVDVGVLVNCVAPAMAQTELLDEMTDDYISMVKAKIPMGRLCTVGEIADMVAWVAGPECTFCTGAVFDLSGGRATY